MVKLSWGLCREYRDHVEIIWEILRDYRVGMIGTLTRYCGMEPAIYTRPSAYGANSNSPCKDYHSKPGLHETICSGCWMHLGLRKLRVSLSRLSDHNNGQW